MAGPNGGLLIFLEYRPPLAWSGPTPPRVPDLDPPDLKHEAHRRGNGGAGRRGGVPPRPSPPNENGRSPCEAPPAPPLSEPQRARINGRRERLRGLLFVPLSQACLRRRLCAPIDQACGKIPPPGLPLWSRCQAAPGVTTPRRALPPAVGTGLRDRAGSREGRIARFSK